MRYQELDIKIYSFYYQPKSLILARECYVPIWAGKNGQKPIDGFYGDDSGINISAQNKYYSELTGLYWIWKNTHSDVVGSCHYRRYFTNSKEPLLYKLKRVLYHPARIWKKRYGLIYTRNFKLWQSRILSAQEINKLLETYDAILPVRRKLGRSIREHYKRYHNTEDLIRIKGILKEYFPEYLTSFESTLNTNRVFANNMFILKWETFDKLMEWLFFILFKFEEESNLEHYSGYQERIFGFLSERLITVWIMHNKVEYKELPLIYFKKLKPAINA